MDGECLSLCKSDLRFDWKDLTTSVSPIGKIGGGLSGPRQSAAPFDGACDAQTWGKSARTWTRDPRLGSQSVVSFIPNIYT